MQQNEKEKYSESFIYLYEEVQRGKVEILKLLYDCVVNGKIDYENFKKLVNIYALGICKQR